MQLYDVETYLVFDSKVLEDIRKSLGQVDTRMGPRNPNEIQKHRYRGPFMFEVNREGDIRLVIR
jgi:hypothetical protein